MTLSGWAVKWGISHNALVDLQLQMGMLDPLPDSAAPGRSEGAMSNLVRVEASRKGMRVWRNNVGVLPDASGRPVRYGLCNDSPQLNRKLKSADLIGINPVLVGRQHVGQTIGQFVSFEVKEEGWHYTGTPREEAQQAWALLVLSLGGDAKFVCREGML